MKKDLSIKRLTGQFSLRSRCPLMTAERGRSMVEMLGVLAVIGILSAGALAGYSRAMFRHKLNRQTEQYSEILQGVLKYRELIDEMDGHERLAAYKNLNIIPKEMITEKGIYDIFKLPVIFDRGFVWAVIENINEQNAQICQNIMQSFALYGNEIYAVGINNGVQGEGHREGWIYGGLSPYPNKLEDLTVEKLMNLCEQCKDGCNIYAVINP